MANRKHAQTTTATTSNREIFTDSQKARPSHNHHGSDIMHSLNPSTEDLRRWAADKEFHNPGQDGSIDLNNPGTMQSMVFGGAMRLPRKGDTLPPPDERLGVGKFGHGQAEYIEPRGGEEGDHYGKAEKDRSEKGEQVEGKTKHALSTFFHRKKKEGVNDSESSE